MITLQDISLRRGSKILLEHLDWTIYPKERIGIIGENGSGKTSLFSMLLQELEPDHGDLVIAKNLRFAYVKQETPSTQRSALDYVLDGDKAYRRLEHLINEAEMNQNGMEIATLYEKFLNIDGYTASARAATLLAGLNFSAQDQKKLVSEFSGGWRVRLNLAQALMAPSDVLLLDEPTNHLDLDTIFWLEEWLALYPGTLLLISHDRDFLDATVDQIAYLNDHTLKLYQGNYSTFEKQRALDLQVQQATYEKQQKQLDHMQSFVDRFRYKASKAKQAQSRLKAIEREILGIILPLI